MPAHSPRTSVVHLNAAQTIPLRHSVLWPDQPPAFVVLPEDDLDSTIHLGIVLDGEPSPVSILTLIPAPFPSDDLGHIKALRFRKFATALEHQGRGFGAQLLAAAFALADGELGVGLVWCDARVEQQPWYERRGMLCQGDDFEKEGRSYTRMVRSRLEEGART